MYAELQFLKSSAAAILQASMHYLLFLIKAINVTGFGRFDDSGTYKYAKGSSNYDEHSVKSSSEIGHCCRLYPSSHVWSWYI